MDNGLEWDPTSKVARCLWSALSIIYLLCSLMPKPPPQLTVKRKLYEFVVAPFQLANPHLFSDDRALSGKKKKPTSKTSSAPYSLDPSDRLALSRRAERFSREHEIERQKALRGGNGSSQVTPPNSNLINRIKSHSRSGSPSPWSNDGLDGSDRVCGSLFLMVLCHLMTHHRRLTGPSTPLLGLHSSYSRII